MRTVIGWKGSDKNAASVSEMSGFETELLTQKDYLSLIHISEPTRPY